MNKKTAAKIYFSGRENMRIALNSFIICLTIITSALFSKSVNKNNIQLNFNASSRTIEFKHRKLGKFLNSGVVTFTNENKKLSTHDKNITTHITADSDSINIILNREYSVSFHIGDNSNIYCTTTGRNNTLVTFTAQTEFKHPDAIPAILKSNTHTDNNVLTTTLGPAEIQ